MARTNKIAMALLTISAGATFAGSFPTNETVVDASTHKVQTKTPSVLKLSVAQRAALLLLAGGASHLQGETITLYPQGNGTQVFKTETGEVVATVFTTGRVTRTVDLPTGESTKVNLTSAYKVFGGSSEYRDLAANIEVM
jgi:hypothetical protein